MIERTNGVYTVAMSKHCGACTHGNDGGVLGAAYACALDGVARYAWEACGHPDAFALHALTMEERYPAYGADHWAKNKFALEVQDKMLGIAVEKGEAVAVPMFGNKVAILSRWAAMRAGPDGDEYNVPGETPKGAA